MREFKVVLFNNDLEEVKVVVVESNNLVAAEHEAGLLLKQEGAEFFKVGPVELH